MLDISLNPIKPYSSLNPRTLDSNLRNHCATTGTKRFTRCRRASGGAFRRALTTRMGLVEGLGLGWGDPILRGSWVVISGVTSPLVKDITAVTLLITPLITTHEPPSIVFSYEVRGQVATRRASC